MQDKGPPIIPQDFPGPHDSRHNEFEGDMVYHKKHPTELPLLDTCDSTDLTSQDSLSGRHIAALHTQDKCDTPTDLSSTDDGCIDFSVSSSVMLLCVSALPYVLQVCHVVSC